MYASPRQMYATAAMQALIGKGLMMNGKDFLPGDELYAEHVAKAAFVLALHMLEAEAKYAPPIPAHTGDR